MELQYSNPISDKNKITKGFALLPKAEKRYSMCGNFTATFWTGSNNPRSQKSLSFQFGAFYRCLFSLPYFMEFDHY